MKVSWKCTLLVYSLTHSLTHLLTVSEHGAHLQRVADGEDELERDEVTVDSHYSEHPRQTEDRKNHNHVANQRPDRQPTPLWKRHSANRR